MMSVLWLFISLSILVHRNIAEEFVKTRPSNSVYLDCFDVFIPLVNRLANEAKEQSQTCAAIADSQKDRELISINRTRSDLFSEVKRIKETLAACTTHNNHQGYFECLQAIIEIDKKVVGDITMKSSKYSNKIKEIEEQMINCFRNIVYKVKEKSSKATYSLQVCLTSGEPAKSEDEVTMDGRDTPTPPFIEYTTSSYNRNRWN